MVIGEDNDRKYWTDWVRREIDGNQMVQDAAASAALQEIARGRGTTEAAEAARRMAQSLGVVQTPGPGQALACQLCGSSPAANMTIHEHNGRVFWMVHKTYKGPFCRDCGMAMFREHQNSTLFQGWFGMFSFFITPITLLLNLVAWERLRALGPPHRDPQVKSRIPAPLSPGKPLLSRVGPYVAVVVVAGVAMILFLKPADNPAQTTANPNPNVFPTFSPRPTPAQSDLPVAQASPFPVRGAAFSFTSQAGDFIGQGHAETLTPPAWSFVVGQGNLGQGGLAIDVRSGAGAGLVVWTVNLAAPRGQSLQVGTYSNVMRAAFREGSQPGLDVYGDGRGCSQVFGNFTITKIEIGPNGAVTALDATFVQHCESPAAPALNGHLRYTGAA
jgi:hypothetical protein